MKTIKIKAIYTGIIAVVIAIAGFTISSKEGNTFPTDKAAIIKDVAGIQNNKERIETLKQQLKSENNSNRESVIAKIVKAGKRVILVEKTVPPDLSPAAKPLKATEAKPAKPESRRVAEMVRAAQMSLRDLKRNYAFKSLGNEYIVSTPGKWGLEIDRFPAGWRGDPVRRAARAALWRSSLGA